MTTAKSWAVEIMEGSAVEVACADAALRVGECPAYVNNIGLARERVYCDRGVMHDRHGACWDDRHQADPGNGVVVFWW